MAQQTFEEIAAAVKQAESGGKRYKDDGKTLTTSAKGALGEMQVMPKTIRDPGFGVVPARDKSPDEIARVGRDYLQAMLGKYGDMDKALAAYNWGPGSTDKWIAAGAKLEKLPEETRTYIQRVKGFLEDKPVTAGVSRETPAPRKALPPSLPPMAAAVPGAAPAAPALDMKQQVASLGPGYQAALALSFLSDTDDKEDRDTEREPGIAEQFMAQTAARPSALAQFADFKIRSPFAEPQPPVRMAGGGEASSSKSNYHPDVQKALNEGRISAREAALYNPLHSTKGNPSIGSGGVRDGVSEKMMNYIRDIKSGKQAMPEGWSRTGAPEGFKAPVRSQPLDLSREQLRSMNIAAPRLGGISEYANTYPAGGSDSSYRRELLQALKESPDYQPYIEELNRLDRKDTVDPVKMANGGQVELPMYDPEGKKYILNEQGGSEYVDSNPSWSAKSDAEKASYYSQNPTMAGITQLGQKALGFTSLGMLQNALVPGFVSEQGLIAMGVDPAAYQGAKESFRGSEIAAMNADAAAAAAQSISDQSSAGSEAGGYGTGDTSGGFGEGQYNRGGLVRRANGSPEEGEQAASDPKEDQLLAMVDQMPAPAARVVLQDLAQGPRAIVSPRVMESLAKRAAMQMGSARQQMFALSREPRYSVEGGGTGQAASLYGSADIPVGDASSLRLGAGGYRVDVPGYKESGLTSTDIGFRTPFMGGNFSAGVSRDMQRGVNAGSVGYARKFDNGGEVDRQGEREAAERQAASRPAFITPSSGRGRAISTKPGELEAAALQGVSEYPYLLAGAPMDISNMIANAFGGGVEKPFLGSEDLKERALKAGIRQKPPEGNAARALYELTQLGTSAMSPTSIPRAAARGASAVGKSAAEMFKLDPALPLLVTKAPAQEVSRVMPPVQTPRPVPAAIPVAAPPAARPNPPGWDTINTMVVDTEPVPVMSASAARTARQDLQAQDAINAQLQGAPAGGQQLALPLDVPARVPTTSNPFVGRLDAFVETLKGPVTKDQFLGQLKGKFRDYDIARAEEALSNLPAGAKIKPGELKSRLGEKYSPANFRTDITEPNNQSSYFSTMDNVFKDDRSKPMGIVNLLAETPKKIISEFEIQTALKSGINKDINDLVSPSTFSYEQVKGQQELQKKIINIKQFLKESAPAEKAAKLSAKLDEAAPRVFEVHKNYDELRLAINDVKYPAISPRISKFQDQLNLDPRYSKLSYMEKYAKAKQMVVEDSYNTLRQFGVNPPSARLYDTDRSLFEEKLQKAVAPAQKLTRDAVTEVSTFLAPVRNTVQEMLSKINSPVYVGQHPSLNTNLGQYNPIAFSRFTDHTATITGVGKKEGMYIHELQSDMLDDLMKTGKKGGSKEKDLKELDEFMKKKEQLLAIPENPTAEQLLEAKTRNSLIERASMGAAAKDKDFVNDLIKDNPKYAEAIIEGLKINTRLGTLNVRTRSSAKNLYSIPEPVAGITESPQVAQQLMAKNAIVAAMQRGKEFVSFPGAESTQSQLYAKLPNNLKQVVKDLGPGFEIRQIELPKLGKPKGTASVAADGTITRPTAPDYSGEPLVTLGVTWSPEAAARILKTGVPFAKGGMVERQTDDNRRYL